MDDAEFGFHHAPIGLVLTRHRIIGHCNARFAEMFGYAIGELQGRSISLLYPSEREFADVGRWALRAMTDGLPYEDQRLMKRRNGDHFWCHVHGRSTTPDNVYDRCVWSFTDLSSARPAVQLTRREREIAMFVIDGMSNKEIARQLGVSHRTIEAHRSRMMRKLKAGSSAELLSILAGLPGLVKSE